jgi:hypothetical protein
MRPLILCRPEQFEAWTCQVKYAFPRVVYFDTNVFDNILKRRNNVTTEDEMRLRSTLAGGNLSVLLSIINIQETIDARKPEIVLPQLRLILDLTSWDQFVKPHDLVLTDDIRHFAWNGEPDRPFFLEPVVSQVRSALLRLLDGTGNLSELDDVINLNNQQKQHFLNGIENARAETYAQIQALIEKEHEEIPSFEQYLASQQEKLARDFARRLGVQYECERRGIAQFLSMKSVKMTSGLGLSFMFRAAVEGKAPKRGASRDLQHLVPAAAAADTFVTHDAELAFMVRRVPMNGFQVTTLRELLDQVAPK